jgi:hypothetical protein
MTATFTLTATRPGYRRLPSGGAVSQNNESMDATWTFDDGMIVHVSTPADRRWFHGRSSHGTRSSELTRKPRVYVHDQRPFNVIEDLTNRTRRPSHVFKPIAVDALARIGLTGKLRWSQYAGCTCPCSPGFVLDCDDPHAAGCTIWVSIPDVPMIDDTKPPRVIFDRAESEPCQRGTIGCSVDHVDDDDEACQTW